MHNNQEQANLPKPLFCVPAVKTGNTFIDHKQKRLVLGDWGLGEFYFPNTAYKVEPRWRQTPAACVLQALLATEVLCEPLSSIKAS